MFKRQKTFKRDPLIKLLDLSVNLKKRKCKSSEKKFLNKNQISHFLFEIKDPRSYIINSSGANTTLLRQIKISKRKALLFENKVFSRKTLIPAYQEEKFLNRVKDKERIEVVDLIFPEPEKKTKTRGIGLRMINPSYKG